MNEIIEKIGLSASLEQLAEECAELGKASLKLARIQRKENPTPMLYDEALKNLEEECADVKLCIKIISNYLKLNYIEQIMDEKYNRWIKRINKEGK